ncbi:hypothetical protein MF672_031410 [Actinomadura sp. ATCC 31491]|uniref:Uncharacterized protein n=1 Tax=Actinomadura luzonensis TaxID=2805427 RepID=A0ABT0G252_9ACTN|nr:hypothetical protein [Actinomadura luzonensis]MCK2218265.1 hypothetical protein [Actinomadura luzonensis]
MSGFAALLRRHWPALIVGAAVVLSFAVTYVVDVVQLDEIRAQVNRAAEFLVFIVAALSVPRCLVQADASRARPRRNPEAYAAAAVALVTVVVGALPSELLGSRGEDFLDALRSFLAVCVAALITFAVFRVQARNERAAPPRTRLHAADDLEEKFTAMAQQLSASAATFALLQAEMTARAHAARELAREAEENRRHAEQSRTYADDQRAALEAVERLVAARAEPIVDAIERRSRRSQVIFLAVGAVLGTVLQLLTQQWFSF